jgi:hypothetical protein
MQRKYKPSNAQLVLLAILAAFFSSSNVSAQNGNANINASTNTNQSGNVNTGSNVNTGNTNAGTTASPVKTPLPCPSPEALSQVAVSRAFHGTGNEEGGDVELGDELTVEVKGLKVLLQKAQCSSPNKKILLFLDGRPIKDVTPFPPTDPVKELLIFPLKRTESSRETWTYILGHPSWSSRKTNISVGLEDEYPVESTASIQLEVLPQGWFTFWFILFLALTAIFVVLAVKSDLLRGSGAPVQAPARKPYSLARMQAAWWFFLILASYLLIGLVTGDFSTSITGTVVILLGISAGTAMGAAVIDVGKEAAPPAAGAAAADPAAAPTNRYWWLDILSDENGVNFHRFQAVVWNIVLGIIFVVQVYKVLAMPNFDGTLLALMGISAGTYLGLKIPEPK